MRAARASRLRAASCRAARAAARRRAAAAPRAATAAARCRRAPCGPCGTMPRAFSSACAAPAVITPGSVQPGIGNGRSSAPVARITARALTSARGAADDSRPRAPASTLRRRADRHDMRAPLAAEARMRDERRAAPSSRRRGSRRSATGARRCRDRSARRGRLLVDEHGRKAARARPRRRGQPGGPRADHQRRRSRRDSACAACNMPSSRAPCCVSIAHPSAPAPGSLPVARRRRSSPGNRSTRPSCNTARAARPMTGVVRQAEAGREHRGGDRVALARRARAPSTTSATRPRPRVRQPRNIEARAPRRAHQRRASAPSRDQRGEQPRMRGGERDAAVARREECAGRVVDCVVHRESRPATSRAAPPTCARRAHAPAAGNMRSARSAARRAPAGRRCRTARLLLRIADQHAALVGLAQRGDRIAQERRSRSMHDDLAALRPHRRRQPDHRRERAHCRGRAASTTRRAQLPVRRLQRNPRASGSMRSTGWPGRTSTPRARSAACSARSSRSGFTGRRAAVQCRPRPRARCRRIALRRAARSSSSQS